jgi:hypothetical protein
MSGKWISIERPPCGRAFAASVASWAMAMARTMDSPRPWCSSTRVRSSRWKGSKRRWTCSGGITGPASQHRHDRASLRRQERVRPGDHSRAARSRGLDEAPCRAKLGGVIRAISLVAREVGRQDLARRDRTAPSEGAHDSAPVNGEVHRSPHPHVVERRHAGVQEEVVDRRLCETTAPRRKRKRIGGREDARVSSGASARRSAAEPLAFLRASERGRGSRIGRWVAHEHGEQSGARRFNRLQYRARTSGGLTPAPRSVGRRP